MTYILTIKGQLRNLVWLDQNRLVERENGRFPHNIKQVKATESAPSLLVQPF